MPMRNRAAFFKCISCGAACDLKGRFFRCRCGGLLDIDGLDDAFSPDLLENDVHGVFRYRRLMPSIV